MNKKREEIALEDRWNVESMYSDRAAWEKEFHALIPEKQKPRWPEIADYRGKLDESPCNCSKLFFLKTRSCSLR